jgi:autotransporter-associated beta strand protein
MGRIRYSFLTAAAVAISLSLLRLTSQAAPVYWDGTATAWETATGWSTASNAATPNPASAPSSSSIATFNISTVNSDQTVEINPSRTVSGLAFTSSGSVLIKNGPGSTSGMLILADGITLAPGSGGARLAVDYVNAGTNGQSWINNSSNALTVDSPIFDAFSGATLNIGGSGDTNLNGDITSSAKIVKSGAGTLTLGGSTDNVALVLVANAGTVVLDKASVATPGFGIEVHAVGNDVTVAGALVKLAGTGGDQIYSTDTVDIQSGAFDMNGRDEGFATLKLAGAGLGGTGALLNSAPNTTSTLTLGSFGTGIATLAGNATIGGAGNLNLSGQLSGNFALTKVGAGTFATGSATYTGGTTIHEGTLIAFSNSALGAAAGPVVVDTAGKLSFSQNATTGRLITLNGGTLEIAATKTLQLTGGTLVNNGTVTGTLAINNGSIAKGSGAFDAVVINDGGTFAPGNSPAVATANSFQFATSGGTLSIELAGTTPGTQYDQLHVSGALTLGGQLNVSLTGGFSPSAGNTFDILDFGTLVGTFSTIALPGLTPGLTWDTSQLYINGTLSVAAVPEPKGIALLLLPAIFAAKLRGRNRQNTAAASPSG